MFLPKGWKLNKVSLLVSISMNPFLSLFYKTHIWKHLQVKDLMPEFSSMLLAVLIGGFTIIGGLGGTFYVSYINGIFIFSVILILQVSNF